MKSIDTLKIKKLDMGGYTVEVPFDAFGSADEPWETACSTVEEVCAIIHKYLGKEHQTKIDNELQILKKTLDKNLSSLLQIKNDQDEKFTQISSDQDAKFTQLNNAIVDQNAKIEKIISKLQKQFDAEIAKVCAVPSAKIPPAAIETPFVARFPPYRKKRNTKLKNDNKIRNVKRRKK